MHKAAAESQNSLQTKHKHLVGRNYDGMAHHKQQPSGQISSPTGYEPIHSDSLNIQTSQIAIHGAWSWGLLLPQLQCFRETAIAMQCVPTTQHTYNYAKSRMFMCLVTLESQSCSQSMNNSTSTLPSVYKSKQAPVQTTSRSNPLHLT